MNVKKLAITIKGSFTSKLYSIADYEDIRRQLPANIQISPFRYELDGKQRIHAHGVVQYTGKYPYFKHYFGPGWYVHTSDNPTNEWISYIEKGNNIDEETLEYRQLLNEWRKSGNQFQQLGSDNLCQSNLGESVAERSGCAAISP